jgi:glycosyltransferase involved in cell wall biosynthesis
MGETQTEAGGPALEAQVSRIFKGNPALRDIYLLLGDPYNGGDRKSLPSKLSFLLWFAVFGRSQYQAICNIDEAYLALLGTPLASGSTLLGHYLAELEAGPRPEADPGPARQIGAARGLFGPLLGPQKDALGRAAPCGISIIGFPLSTVGIGEDVRCLAKVLHSLGVAVNLVDVSPEQLEKVTEADDYVPLITARPIFATVIVCLPFFEHVRIMGEWGPQALAGRRRIGYFAWELTEIDPCWHDTLRRFDEIWSSSRFTFDVFKVIRGEAVHLVPMLVDVPAPDLSVKVRYDLPTDFSCLVFIDFMSTLKRKNAIGAVRAFRQAFADPSLRVSLVVKTMHAEFHTNAWAELRGVIGDDERIVVVDGPLSRAETLGLIATSDVFLSLHRAEGFGRVLAEAMALGTLVVATDWSGSRDIVQSDTGFPIRCSLVPVGAADYYEAAGLWAEPDIGHAAEVLRELEAHPERRAAVRTRARAHVARHFSLAPVRARVADRLRAIGLLKDRAG